MQFPKCLNISLAIHCFAFLLPSSSSPGNYTLYTFEKVENIPSLLPFHVFSTRCLPTTIAPRMGSQPRSGLREHRCLSNWILDEHISQAEPIASVQDCCWNYLERHFFLVGIFKLMHRFGDARGQSCYLWRQNKATRTKKAKQNTGESQISEDIDYFEPAIP